MARFSDLRPFKNYIKQMQQIAYNTFHRQVILAVAIILTAIFVSCSNPESSKVSNRHSVAILLDRAESMLGTNDSTALATLDSIDATAIRSRKQNARYALLYSEALYKNYIPVASDSLIMEAVRYYSTGSDIRSRFRAFYLVGCIYSELDRKPDALLAFTQAEHLASSVTDDYQLGLLNTQLGLAFFNSFDFSRALDYYNAAYTHYSKAGKESHEMHALYDIASCQLQLNNLERAYTLFDSIQTMASNAGDYYLLYNCQLNKLNSSMFLGDDLRARTDMEQITELFGDAFDDAISLSTFAKYNILAGNLQKARFYLDKGWNNSTSISDSVSMYEYESLLLEKSGSFDSAVVICRDAIYMERKNVQTGLGNPLTSAMSDYYKNISEIEMLKASRNHYALVLSILILVAVVVVFILSIRSRRLKYESTRQSLIITINELRLKENSNNETINRLNAKINGLFSRPLQELDSVLSKMIDSDALISSGHIKSEVERKKLYQNQTGAFYEEIKRRFDMIVSDKYQDELDEIINSSCDNIMEQITSGPFAISKKDLLILRLSIAGFSPNSISYLTGITRTSVYKQRQRTIEKIEKTTPDLVVKLRNILNISSLSIK